MNVSTLKAGDRVEGLQPYTIESIEKSGLNGEYLAVVVYDSGVKDRFEFPADTDSRCSAVHDFGDGGDRCQLAHDSGDHVAYTQAYPTYDTTEYRSWNGDTVTRSVDEPAGADWADGCPRIEHDRALDVERTTVLEPPSKPKLLRRRK